MRDLQFSKPGDPLNFDPEPCPDCHQAGVCRVCQQDIDAVVAEIQGRLCQVPADLLAAIPSVKVRRLSSGKN